MTTNTCDACEGTCFECDGPDSDNCTKCNESRYLSVTSCVTICPVGTFPDISSNTCKNCDGSCYTCDEGNNSDCLSC